MLELEQEKRSFLVLDPGGELRKLVEMLLAPIARRIVHARSAEDGYSLALAERPDVIIAFCGLHHAGSRLCRLIRQEPQVSQTPFVILTSSSNIKDYPSFLANGCDQILPIPFRCQHFFATIKEALARTLASGAGKIQVLLQSGRTSYVERRELDHLIDSHQILCFRRCDGLAILGKDPVRSRQPATFDGEERRQSPL